MKDDGTVLAPGVHWFGGEGKVGHPEFVVYVRRIKCPGFTYDTNHLPSGWLESDEISARLLYLEPMFRGEL